MPKIVYLTAALSIALISSLSEVALVHTAASAQEYSGCFMISNLGSLVNLDVLCSDEIKISQPKLVFTALQSQLILDGSMAQVTGTVTNRSNQVVPLSLIYFQLVADTRILASSSISVETGDGLNPGESLSFDKVINKSHLGNVAPSVIEVKITKYE